MGLSESWEESYLNFYDALTKCRLQATEIGALKEIWQNPFAISNLPNDFANEQEVAVRQVSSDEKISVTNGLR